MKVRIPFTKIITGCFSLSQTQSIVVTLAAGAVALPTDISTLR